MSERDIQLEQEVSRAAEISNRILNAIQRRIIGQDNLRRRLVTALLVDGHVLLEGVPGLAKTLSIRALAEAVHASFKRIQFTPDLLPADLLGTEVFRPQDGQFEVRKGPVFAHFILADEINRAPAKVQSALLETMQERQVTIGTETFPVPRPFFVLATQNPVEQEGTYPLPEAQIDRFMLKVRVDYPEKAEELEILKRIGSSAFDGAPLEAVASLDDIAVLKSATEKIYVDERVQDYIVDLVWASRDPKRYKLKLDNLLELGASPRASIALQLVAKAEALLEGQTYVSPQNVKDVAHDVLRHRLIPTYEAEAQGLSSEEIVSIILDGVQVP